MGRGAGRGVGEGEAAARSYGLPRSPPPAGRGTCCVDHHAGASHNPPSPHPTVRPLPKRPSVAPSATHPPAQTPDALLHGPGGGGWRRPMEKSVCGTGSQSFLPSASPLGPARRPPGRLLPALRGQPRAPPAPPACDCLVPSRVTARLHVLPEAVCPLTIVSPECSGPSWRLATKAPGIRVRGGTPGRCGAGGQPRDPAWRLAPCGKQGRTGGGGRESRARRPQEDPGHGAALPPHHP